MPERRQRLTLWTAETNWVAPGCPETENPYQRVERVGFGLRYTLSAARQRRESEQEATEEIISWLTPNAFGGRLYDFYQLFLSRRRPELEISNCFDFATWMDGIELPKKQFGRILLPDWSTTYEYVCSIRETGAEVTEPQPLGTHVVLGVKDTGFSDFLSVLHSAVSLGDDSDRCIQIMSDNPYHRIMGIDTYANILDYYQKLPGNVDTELAFFARTPPQG